MLLLDGYACIVDRSKDSVAYWRCDVKGRCDKPSIQEKTGCSRYPVIKYHANITQLLHKASLQSAGTMRNFQKNVYIDMF